MGLFLDDEGRGGGVVSEGEVIKYSAIEAEEIKYSVIEGEVINNQNEEVLIYIQNE